MQVFVLHAFRLQPLKRQIPICKLITDLSNFRCLLKPLPGDTSADSRCFISNKVLPFASQPSTLDSLLVPDSLIENIGDIAPFILDQALLVPLVRAHQIDVRLCVNQTDFFVNVMSLA